MTRALSSGQPTIIEVAKLAGVSFKTVARVINNEPSVRPETREAVFRAMRMLNYVPNISARQLRSRRSYLIVVLARYFDEYSGGALSGALARCRELGYNLIVEEVPQGVEVDVANRLQSLRVDGLVLIPPLPRDRALLAALRTRGLRHVLIQPAHPDEQAASVSIDDRQGALEMTRYLVNQGHRDIAFIGASDWPASRRRHAGFLEGLAEAGIPRRKLLEADGGLTFQSGLDSTDLVLARAIRPTAIFATTDAVALGALMAAARRGIHVPSQLSIAGFDDTASASLVWPQLTTVRQPIRQMCAAAIDLLDGDASLTPSALLFEFELIIRGSTAPPGPR